MTFEELLEAVAILDDSQCKDFLNENGCELVDGGGWEDFDKFQYCEEVYHHVPSGRFLMLVWSREGEYWNGFDYSLQDVFEVEPKIVTKTEYFKKEQTHE